MRWCSPYKENNVNKDNHAYLNAIIRGEWENNCDTKANGERVQLFTANALLREENDRRSLPNYAAFPDQRSSELLANTDARQFIRL